ncbi:MAG: LUD domain-containing protein [Nautiliaceae bacterium]
MDEFITNLKLAGGEVLEEIPDGWYVSETEFGVMENGAVWVRDYKKELFLSEKVAVKMPKKFVKTVQEAVELIESPGLFISGPSKTADVESFLVFGAHGPIRFGVIFDKNL